MADDAPDLDLPPHLPQWIVDHIQLYYTDPEAAHHWDSTVAGGPGPLPTLLLVTVGRTSGKVRPLPLIYKEVDGAFVIIASKGGAPEHPLWYRNLEAMPECEIRVGPRELKVRARDAQGEERDRLWKELAEIYPPYDDYRVAAGDREIPVVVLDPVA